MATLYAAYVVCHITDSGEIYASKTYQETFEADVGWPRHSLRLGDRPATIERLYTCYDISPKHAYSARLYRPDNTQVRCEQLAGYNAPYPLRHLKVTLRLRNRRRYLYRRPEEPQIAGQRQLLNEALAGLASTGTGAARQELENRLELLDRYTAITATRLYLATGKPQAEDQAEQARRDQITLQESGVVGKDLVQAQKVYLDELIQNTRAIVRDDPPAINK